MIEFMIFLWNKRRVVIGIGIILILLFLGSSCGSTEANTSISKGLWFETEIVSGTTMLDTNGDGIADLEVSEIPEGVVDIFKDSKTPIVVLFDLDEQLYQGHCTVEEDVSLYILCTQYYDYVDVAREYFSPNPRFSRDSLFMTISVPDTIETN